MQCGCKQSTTKGMNFMFLRRNLSGKQTCFMCLTLFTLSRMGKLFKRVGKKQVFTHTSLPYVKIIYFLWKSWLTFLNSIFMFIQQKWHCLFYAKWQVTFSVITLLLLFLILYSFKLLLIDTFYFKLLVYYCCNWIHLIACITIIKI